MALFNCPECDHYPVSDKAAACPRCDCRISGVGEPVSSKRVAATGISSAGAGCRVVVSGKGKYGTIMEALGQASDSDVIVLEPGSYTEAIQISHSPIKSRVQLRSDRRMRKSRKTFR